MIITIVLLFAVFISLEVFSRGRTFGFGANPIALFIFHLLRLGLLLAAMILTWFYSQILFWGILTILIILLCMSFFLGSEKRKIKKIVVIYKSMENTSPEASKDSLLRITTTKYYQSLGWDSEEINATIKTLFNNPKDSPKDISTLAAWLLTFEKPNVMNRFGRRYKLASEFYKKSTCPDRLKAIAEIEKQLRFCIYLRLRRQYEAELDGETASVLAVQVTNHLMGDDFAKVYNSLTSDVQEKVDAVRALIEAKAHEAMTRDTCIRELIIRHIMTTSLIYHCLFDKAWFDKPEIHNREQLIRKYGGSEFSQVEDFDQYMAFASNFIRTIQRTHQQEEG